MTDEEYLEEVLKNQDLADDSVELKELQAHRKAVETLIRNRFSTASPTIRYGGSRAKGTLIKEYYDLDIVCYFPHDSVAAGDTLKDIYQNVRKALEGEYDVQQKTSALRLRSKEPLATGNDFHIDVVPGRYMDGTETDCFLHQSQGEKDYLKTNLETHIDHIKNSGVIEAIRLLKLWKARQGLEVKQFIFELLIVRLLAEKKEAPLSDQLRHVWAELAKAEEPIAVEDPANPSGNDLMPAIRGNTWAQLSSAAASTLQALEHSGWEAIFGAARKVDESARVARLQAAAAAVTRPTRPWAIE